MQQAPKAMALHLVSVDNWILTLAMLLPPSAVAAPKTYYKSRIPKSKAF